MNQHVPTATFERLAELISERAQSGGDASYTRKLIDKGLPKICKKLGEEAVEVVVAALAEDREALKAELADLVYHMLVLCEATGVGLDEVALVLNARFGRSGVEEKASRKLP
jgi:phosphoribosyl-ATP pyrophosphohydrolase